MNLTNPYIESTAVLSDSAISMLVLNADLLRLQLIAL